VNNRQQTVKEPHTDLRTDVSQAMDELKSAITAVIDALPDARPATASEFASRLGVSRALGWRVWKLVADDGAEEAAGQMPGVKAFRRFCDAARSAGVDAACVERASEAHADLRGLLAKHAWDTASTHTLLSRVSGRGDRGVELRFRRELFRAQAYSLGVRCLTQYDGFVAVPGPDPSRVELCFLTAYAGLSRSRSDQRWLINTRRVTNRFGPTDYLREDGIRYEALESDGGDFDRTPALIRSLCSVPIAPVRRQRLQNSLEDELMPGEVGKTAATDVYFGERLLGLPPDEDPTVVFYPRVVVPAEHWCAELILHRDAHDGSMPVSAVYSGVHDRPSFMNDDDRDRLPVPERLLHIGSAADVVRGAATGGVPRHEELMAVMSERLGYAADEFQVYRLSMEYPPIPVSLWLEYRRKM